MSNLHLKRWTLPILAVAAVGFCGMASADLVRKSTGARPSGKNVRELASSSAAGNTGPSGVIQEQQEIPSTRPEIPLRKLSGTAGLRVPANASGSGVNVYFCINPQDNKLHTPGAYRVNVDDPEHVFTLISGENQPNASKGGVPVDDYYYATQTYNFPMKDWTVVWDMSKGFEFTGTVYDGLWRLYADDACYDPWTDRIIGSVSHTYSKSSYTLASIDYDRHRKEFIGPEYEYTKRMLSVAAGKDWYYGIDYNNNFYKIDKFTGEATLVGPTGVSANQVNTGSMACDPRTGRLFYSAIDNNRDFLSSFYEINPETGVATMIWEDQGAERRHGLWCDELTVAGCPGLVGSLAADFAVGAKSGRISFVAPSTLYDGSQVTGALTYTILDNGREIATGSAQCGEKVDVTVNIATDGVHKFSVKTANAAGPSRWARTMAAVGNVIPAAPAPILERNGNSFTVKWNPVAATSEGIGIDPTLISYKVVRYPGGAVIAENAKDTILTDTPEIGESLVTWYYEVKAVFDEVAQSPAGYTKTLTTGHIVAPYYEDFTDRRNFDPYKVVDHNGDGETWRFDDGSYDIEYLYMYGGSGRSDDWVISPAVHLEAGKYYRVTYSAGNRVETYKPLKARVHWGKGQSVEELTNLLCDTVSVNGAKFIEIGDYVVVNETGDYYFGFQNVSDPNASSAYIRDFRVSAPVLASAPGDVTEVDVRSSADEPSKAVVRFKAPSLCADGSQLTSITKLDVMFDGNLCTTFYNPHPGELLECTVTVPERGRNYEFSFQAYNAVGEGKKWYGDFFIGIRQPSVPTDISAFEQNGQVTVRWTAPAMDYEGNPIGKDYVTYDVQIVETENYMVKTVGENVAGESLTFPYELKSPGEPEIVYLSVRAITEGGNSDFVSCIPVAVGPAYETPWAESFRNGTPTSVYGAVALNGNVQWGLFLDGSFSDLSSQDGDSGFIGMQCQTNGGKGLFALGKIDLAGCTRPVLTYYAYNIQGNYEDDNEVETVVVDSEGMHVVNTTVMSDLEAGWSKVTVPLDEFAGKKIQLAFTATTRSYVFTLIDNVRVRQRMSHNLSIKSIDAPSRVKSNTDFTISAVVENNGDELASGYTVNLLRDGEVVDIAEGPAVGASATVPVTFRHLLTTFDAESAEYSISVEYEADQDEDDNMSDVVVVNNILPNLPVPTGLHGTTRDSQVELGWNRPDIESSSPEPVTTGFEDAESWSTSEAEGWMLFDKDGAVIGGAEGISLPGIDGKSVGFFVFDKNMPQFNESWKPYEGQKMIICMYNKGGVANNDWAVSPLLSGEAQTISFYTRSYSADYLETLKVLASTGGTAPADFTPVRSIDNVPSEWTKYTIDLPAGTKRFALNCVSADKFMLFVDEITFIPDGKLSLDGYYVYRNKSRVHEQPVTGESYSDEISRDGRMQYHVTAVINGVETRPSEGVTLDVSGVTNIYDTDVTVRTEPGYMVFDGLSGDKLVVSDINGRVIYSGTPSGSVRIAAEPGVFVAVIGDKAVKLRIKW